MKIVLLIKQVPESGSVRMDEETGTLIRRDSDAVVNPLDLHALDAALRLKQRFHAETTVISMGPPSAESALREALAMGIDSAVLVTDRSFSGSDTWATGHILAAAISKAAAGFDLILCGERATDGETGQVGPETASALGIPALSGVCRVGDVSDGRIEADRLIEDGTETLSVRLPALLAVGKAAGNPGLPALDGKIRARQAEIRTVGQADLLLPKEETGLAGSPTRVLKLFHPKFARQGVIRQVTDDKSLNEAAGELAAFLRGKGLIR